MVFGSREGEQVRAPVSGQVLFAGRVAGVIYVVVGDPGPAGLRVTVGRLASLAQGIPTAGQTPSDLPATAAPGQAAGSGRVVAGQSLGRAGPTTWLGTRIGERLGGVPVDPEPLLRRWRVSLVPSGRRSVGCATAVTPSGVPRAGRRP